MQRFKQTTRIAAKQICGLLIAGLLSTCCWAHPGHGIGGGDWSVRHYLTEPEHLVCTLGLTLLIAVPFVWRDIRARRAAQARAR